GRDRSTLIDSAVLVLGAGITTWVLVMAPIARDVTMSLGQRMSELADPIGLLVLLSLSVRLLFSRGARTPSFWLLVAAMLVSFVADWIAVHAALGAGSPPLIVPIEAAYLAVSFLAGGGALHPTMVQLSDAVDDLDDLLSKARLTLFVVAALAGPAAYGIAAVTGDTSEAPVVVVGTLLLFMLAAARLAGISKTARSREARFRALVQNSSDVVAILEPDGTISYITPAVQNVLAYSQAEVLDTSALSFVYPSDLPQVVETLSAVGAKEGEQRSFEFRGWRGDGTCGWFECTLTNLSSTPEIAGILANFHDISQRKTAEESLVMREAEARLLFENSPMPLWVFDSKTMGFLAVNETAIHKYGYTREQFLAMRITDMRPEDEREAVAESVRQRGPGLEMTGPWHHMLASGEVIEVEIASHPIDFAETEAIFVAVSDVTARNRAQAEKAQLEQQLLQRQRLEAVGRLAGGIAHDFNNLLAVIQNYAAFARDDVAPEEQRRSDIDEILAATSKATGLVRQLLTFSRKEVAAVEVVDLNAVVHGVHDMVRRTLRESIDLQISLADDLGPVEVDPVHIEQVLMNLIVNASDAIEDSGSIVIETCNRPVDDTLASQRVSLEPGEYVLLSVSDSGSGMDPDVAEMIFEPFFSTKARDVGTGLGLSTVHGIVHQAGGCVTVYSEPGEGTTFHVYLPLAASRAALEVGEERLVQAVRGRGEIVLLVEDEPQVRTVIGRVLRQHGYMVHSAEGPEEALASVADIPRIDLVLTDVIMPKMSGKELVERLSRSRQDFATLFISGYTDDIIATQGGLEPGSHFMHKPFSETDLLRKVREALDSTSKSRGSRILVVDDDPEIVRMVHAWLETTDFQFFDDAFTGAEGVRLAAEAAPDIVVLDFRLPDMEGAQVAAALRLSAPDARIVAFSALLSERPEWADDFVAKTDVRDLRAAVERLAAT
ncbi:MAG: response regulator, partial [Actinobacteria bacterium]|nr:response regulator [Actinomycetota bacterium]